MILSKARWVRILSREVMGMITYTVVLEMIILMEKEGMML